MSANNKKKEIDKMFVCNSIAHDRDRDRVKWRVGIYETEENGQ